MASPPNVFFSIFAVPNFLIMNKIELYEQCKVALHVLNTRPLDLDEYPEAVNAMLRKMGARDVKDGLLRSPETRLAEHLCYLDDFIAREKHEALVERRAKRAEIRANVALIVSIISILLSLSGWRL